MIKKIIFLISCFFLFSCGTIYESIEDESLINDNGYKSILFVYYYYPEEELELHQMYHQNLLDFFDESSTKIAAEYIKIESLEKGFISDNESINNQINTAAFQNKTDLIIYVKNIGTYLNGGLFDGMYKNTAYDIKKQKEVWAGQYQAMTGGILLFRKNLAKSSSEKIFQDLKEHNIIVN